MPSPYMPLYIADYMADTAHLSTLEHGAYLLLIMTYWQTGKPLPNDPKSLARICRMSAQNFTRVQKNILSLFNPACDKLLHPRIEKELAIYKEKCEKSRAAGIKSGESRRNKRSTDAERPFNERSSLVEPQANHSESYTDIKETTHYVRSKEKPKDRTLVNRKILEDFRVLEKHIEFAKREGCPDPHSQIEQFKDHHLARPKNLKEISDWDKAFYNWLRNGKKFQLGGSYGNSSTGIAKGKSKSHELWTELATDLVRGTEHEHLYPGKT